MSDDLVKMCKRLSKYAHAQLSSTDLERIADRIEELEAKLSKYVKACSDLSQQHISEWGRAEELEAKLAKAVEALRAERDYWVKRADADLADQDANERFMDYPIPRKMTEAMRKADALNAALAAFNTGGKADG